MPKNNVNVDINFEADILTPKCAAQLIISIFEVLLFQRNQIPFVFRTFNYLISKWEIIEENNGDISSFNLYRQRKAAISTLEDIKKLKEAIKDIFKTNNEILSIRFLFGTSPELPKEIYQIKIPFISKSHSDEVHWYSADPMIKTILRNILTTEILYKTFSTTVPPTNVFLDVEFNCDDENFETDSLVLKEFVEFPPSCKQITLNLNITPSKNFKMIECCKNLKVFDDNPMNNVTDSLSKTKYPNKNVNWWEAKYSVKGFKENNTTKSLNIWKSDE